MHERQFSSSHPLQFLTINMVIPSEVVSNTHFKFLSILLIVTCAINWGACYGISIYYEKLNGGVYFLSTAMSYDPARVVANIFVPMIALATGAILILRAVLLSTNINSLTQKILFYAFSISAILITVSMIAVSAVPNTVSKKCHLIAAGFVFASGLTSMISSCVLDHIIQLPVEKFVRYYRIILTIVGLSSLIVSGATYAMDNKAISSILEIVGAGTMTLFTLSVASRDEFNTPKGTIQSTEVSSV